MACDGASLPVLIGDDGFAMRDALQTPRISEELRKALLARRTRVERTTPQQCIAALPGVRTSVALPETFFVTQIPRLAEPDVPQSGSTSLCCPRRAQTQWLALDVDDLREDERDCFPQLLTV